MHSTCSLAQALYMYLFLGSDFMPTNIPPHATSPLLHPPHTHTFSNLPPLDYLFLTQILGAGVLYKKGFVWFWYNCWMILWLAIYVVTPHGIYPPIYTDAFMMNLSCYHLSPVLHVVVVFAVSTSIHGTAVVTISNHVRSSLQKL